MRIGRFRVIWFKEPPPGYAWRAARAKHRAAGGTWIEVEVYRTLQENRVVVRVPGVDPFLPVHDFVWGEGPL